MNGATALHTRAACDECRDRLATHEGAGGINLREICGASPRAANDGTLASIGRIHEKPIDALWWLLAAPIRNSDTSSPQDVATTGLSLKVESVVAPNSTCIADGLRSLSPCRPSAGCAAQEKPSANSIATGNGKTPADVPGLAVVGRDTSPDSVPDIIPPALSDLTAGCRSPAAAVLSWSADPGAAGFDLETDALVTGLEVGWLRDRRNSSTLRVVAASEMASADNSKSEAAGA